MKKVLITTLQGANYGNRLQNYALQEFLKKNSCEVYNPYYTPVEYATLAGKTKHNIKMFLGQIGVKKYKKEIAKERKESLFHVFDEKWIDNRFYVDFRDTKKLSEYDYAITGSDQVWHNWSNTDEELKYFYLNFINKERRIAYAPSFGFSTISNDIDIHKEGLKGMENLSCREKRGIEIIKELTGKEATLVPDPTFLLGKEDWMKFEDKPEYEVKKEFVVVYFLGTLDDKAKLMIGQFSEKNIQVINLMDSDNKYYLSTPNHFVWLIHHAQCILTDSFHACVFSIMFNKKFVSFRRKDRYVSDMYDRIQTLLDITDCNQFVEENIRDVNDLNMLTVNDSKNVFSEYKQLGSNFLINALNVESAIKKQN